MELLQYKFFQHALIGAILISICCGIIGTYVVTRRRVFIAGGITHASFGGLGLGFFLGWNPTLTAAIFAVLMSIAIQWIAEHKNVREDSAIAVGWSLGMALGIIFIFLTPGYVPNLTEYLFGNILIISQTDLIIAAFFSAGVSLFSILCYRPILYVAFDAEFARLQGFKSQWIEYTMTILTALTIVLSIRMIGIVLLLSVLTLPQMIANLFKHEYHKLIIWSIIICLAGCIGGLFCSFYLNVPAGACIVTLLVLSYLTARFIRNHRRRYTLPLLCLTAFLFSGCASNTPMNRKIKGMTTKYNVYFNGNEAYEKALSDLEKSTNDDYTKRLLLHPVNQYANSESTPGGGAGFEQAIEKCKKAVTTKSITKRPKRKKRNDPEYKEFLKRGEYNPYIHNAWLLSAKSEFYKGDFNAAQATFGYISRHFWWLPDVITECHIWIARGHAIQGFIYEAETELDLVISHKKYNNQKELSLLPEYRNMKLQHQREFSLVLAEMALQQEGKEEEAIAYLENAQKGFLTQEQKIRTSFLIAQLHQEKGNKAEAYKGYHKIVRKAKDYKTQFNARMAQTLVMPSGNLKKMERKLNWMRLQARNSEYLDQVYFALGNIDMMRCDTAKAIEDYELAVEKSTRNGMDKAVAALRLGEITFEQGDYVKAQKAYSEVMAIIPKDYKNYDNIAKLSSVLDELQTHAESVQLQDSLLHLATLSDEELNKVIEKIIEELIEKEKEAAEAEQLAEYENKKSQNVDPLAQKETPLPTIGEKDDSWYFYNTATVNAGKSDFQRKWGARKPEDDWRRKNKTSTFVWEETAQTETDSISSDNEIAPIEVATEDSTSIAATDSIPTFDEELASDPHNKEYYLAQIPRTEEAVINANKIIEDGMYNMGVIIHEKLDNLPLAIETFGKLETRYPETAHRLEFYYAIYLMYMRMNRPEMAEIYRTKLIETFPESAYSIAISDPQYIQNLRNMMSHQDSLYGETYHAYLDGNTEIVHKNYDFVHEKWPLSTLMPKFLFLHALSYVQEGDIEAFKSALEQLTALYPESDVSPLAGLMIKGVQEGRTIQSGSAPRGLLWTTSLRIAGDSTAISEEATFVDNPDLPHLLLLAYATDSINQNDLLFEVAKFNFENFLIKDFDLEIIAAGELSLLVIKGFGNLEELIEYREKMTYHAGIILPENITCINISEDNFRALIQGRTFDEYFQFMEEHGTSIIESEEDENPTGNALSDIEATEVSGNETDTTEEITVSVGENESAQESEENPSEEEFYEEN